MINKKNIAIIGGGPSGLMAAEVLAGAGHNVTVYDRMPSFGRKFLMAGRGGLNLTHSEPINDFIKRYGDAASWLEPYVRAFTPSQLREWCEGLGQETFIGSSGRIFPKVMKTAPLLRAWLGRLDKLGVKFVTHYTWVGFDSDALKFADAKQEIVLVKPDATLLALGGASWPRLGSDGNWVKILSEYGVEISPLRPANSGFTVDWSPYFSDKFAGTPIKPVVVSHKNISREGEVMITAKGIEGGAIYAISAALRETIIKVGFALLSIDLKPSMTVEALTNKLKAPQGNQSFSNYLRKIGLSPVAISLLREGMEPEKLAQMRLEDLAARIKNMQVKLNSTTGIERAISTAGGITQNALDKNFMLINKPNVFATGEMLDWEAPTGGYLLQGCFSLAVAASKGMLRTFQL